jgi:aminobenzoyl-glutamate utilization protein B
MKDIRIAVLVTLFAMALLPGTAVTAGSPQSSPARLDALKSDALNGVEELKDLTQQMVDTVFSFGELGFQEYETSKYLIGILKKNGFTVQEGVSGIPTAWSASWGTGRPVIALGSDIDCLPQANQKPGIPYREAFVDGAPGHGEGHNSGVPLNITAALAVKRLMEKEHLPGTIRLWPGVAEELVAVKAYYARDGLFKDVDVVLFNHVSSNMNTSHGAAQATGLVSVEYNFKGESSHAAASPWQGRSALDAVELMDIGWNFRREHLRLQQRSHYVITNGGDQPNVVPSTASVWYYFRETEYQRIKDLFELGNTMARAASMMTDTSVSWRILGAAWPQHFNKPVAEAMYENIVKVGLPEWSENDQTLAKAVQREIKVKESGLATEIPKIGLPVSEQDQRGGGSDDIGDVSWCVPTVTLRFPSNIPGLPSHNWVSAIAMATPIAHKGATAGAKVMAATMLDLLMKPELVEQAWDYFRNVQTKELKYTPLVGPEDKPAIDLNRKIMDRYRPEMRKYYFDSTRYKTYLEQLGIPYPAVKK